MRGVDGGRAARRGAVSVGPFLLAALLVLLTACSSGPEPIPVPTFPTPEQRGGPTAAADDPSGAIPDDCTRVLAPGDLEAVLGLPLGSVAVRTIIGVAEPSVRRTERLSCDYTSGPDRRPLLDLTASSYVDDAAAAAQWKVNVAAESGERHDVPLGSASAAVLERRGQASLLVAHAATNLTVVLPDQPLPGGRSRSDVLVDLALRVLPSVSVAAASAPRAGSSVPADARPADARPADARPADATPGGTVF